MKNDNHPLFNMQKVVDLLIRLGVLFLLLSWCIDILKPFLLIMIWGGIIAITAYPLFDKLKHWLGNRGILATLLLTTVILSIIVVPGWLLFESLYEGVQKLKAMREAGEPLIPPPAGITDNWPAMLKPIADAWELASYHIDEALKKYAQELAAIGKWLLGALSSIGFGLVQLIASTIVAGVLLNYTESLSETFKLIFKRLAGDNGESFLEISVTTIRNVVKGIIGVALIQTAITAIGLFAAGIPYAGLWTILCLVLAIAQVGVFLIALPAIIYMFSTSDTMHAVIFTVWMVIALISDNFLKPILLGRGAPVPMLVVFIGAIGGFIYQGFIGLFLGAVILSLGYKLFIKWLETTSESEEA